MAKRIPSYRLHKASGQAVVVIRGDSHYLGQFDTPESRERYERLICEYKAKLHQESVSGRYTWTCDQLNVAYLEHANQYYRKNGKPTGEVHCLKIALRYVSQIYGSSFACEFGPRKLKVCREAMIEGRFSRHPLCRPFVNKTCSRIRRAFKWAVENEQVPAEVLHGLQSIAPLRAGRSQAIEREAVKPVDPDVLEATLDHLRPVIADMVQIQRLTGMRPGELCRLTPDEISRTDEIWLYEPGDHKMQHKEQQRLIAIGPKAQNILQKYLFGAFCFSGLRGNHITIGAYRDAIHRGCEKAGVDNWNPNQLRHNAATEIRRQFGLETARAVLSHSDATTTMIYAERDFGIAREVAKKIG